MYILLGIGGLLESHLLVHMGNQGRGLEGGRKLIKGNVGLGKVQARHITFCTKETFSICVKATSRRRRTNLSKMWVGFLGKMTVWLGAKRGSKRKEEKKKG